MSLRSKREAQIASLNQLCNYRHFVKVTTPLKRTRRNTNYVLRNQVSSRDTSELQMQVFEQRDFLMQEEMADPEEMVRQLRRIQDCRRSESTTIFPTRQDIVLPSKLRDRSIRDRSNDPVVVRMKREIVRLFPEEQQNYQELQLDTKRTRSNSQFEMNEMISENDREHQKLKDCIKEVNNNKFLDYNEPRASNIMSLMKLNFDKNIPRIVLQQPSVNNNLNKPAVLIKDHVFNINYRKSISKYQASLVKSNTISENNLVQQIKPQDDKRGKYYNQWYVDPSKQYVKKLKKNTNLPAQFMLSPMPDEATFFYKNLRRVTSSWKSLDPFEVQQLEKDKQWQRKHVATQDVVNNTQVMIEYKNTLEKLNKRVPIFLISNQDPNEEVNK